MKTIIPPEKIDNKPLSMMQKMDRINENLEAITSLESKKQKKKSFKIPGGVKRQTRNLKKLMKKNKVQVLMLRLTGAMDLTMGEINSGRLIVGENYWNAADDIIWHWLGKTPTAIICDWDMQPITKTRLMSETNSYKSWLHPQTIAIRAMMAKLVADKSPGAKMKPAVWIAIGIVGLVMYYLFLGGT